MRFQIKMKIYLRFYKTQKQGEKYTVTLSLASGPKLNQNKTYTPKGLEELLRYTNRWIWKLLTNLQNFKLCKGQGIE